MSQGDQDRVTYEVRDYRESDEAAWVRCRLLSFLDTSYRDDVQVYRENFEHRAVCLVAALKHSGEVIGLIDTEIDEAPGEDSKLRATIWSMAVLPEYRRRKVASHLWEATRQRLTSAGVNEVQVWTQDDEAANAWYQTEGFEQLHTYLNVYARGPLNAGPMNQLLPDSSESWKYGQIRTFNFEAPMEYKEELQRLSYRIHEVRGYRKSLAAQS